MTNAPAPLAFVVLLLGCAAGPPALLDLGLPEGRRRVALEQRIEATPLAPGEALRVEELGRDAHTSHHLVWIRDREPLHLHARHDLLVVMLRGHGFLRLDEQELPVGAGSILYVPRGRVHAFRNAASRPAVAYVVYVPPFDGSDRVLAHGACQPQVLRCSLPHQGQKLQ